MQIPKSEINPIPFGKKIDYSSRIIFTGSCFAENIGNKLSQLKIPTLINPFGILYNPESVRKSLVDIVNCREFTENDLFFYNEKWISFAHHGTYSAQNKNDALYKINESIKHANEFLSKTDFLFITFGTFRAYTLLNTGKIVANCHKLPTANFTNELLDIDILFDNYCKLIEQLSANNPNMEIVFTVSPVRHWKDGAINNQLSKSYLFILIHKLVKKYNNSHYFPSYEIMMDELRDYRFYADDLFHPSNLAVEYIWSKFEQTYFSKHAIETAKKVKKINQNLNHRVFYPNTEAYKKFVIRNIEQINQIQKQLPEISFSSELEYFQSEYVKYW